MSNLQKTSKSIYAEALPGILAKHGVTKASW